VLETGEINYEIHPVHRTKPVHPYIISVHGI